MKVKQTVLDKLKTNRGMALIMDTLDCSPTTARSLVKNHKKDDDLTKASMVKAIRDKYNLTEDQVLEESEVKEEQI